MKKINNATYSRNPFDGWRYRIMLEGIYSQIYTDQTNRTKAEIALASLVAEGTNCTIIHWTTKEQDDSTTAFLDKLFDDMDAELNLLDQEEEAVEKVLQKIDQQEAINKALDQKMVVHTPDQIEQIRVDKLLKKMDGRIPDWKGR